MRTPHVSLRPATAFTADDIAALMNRAFADYIVPLSVSPDAFDAMVERDDIRLGASHIALLDDQPVGVALVAMRPGRAGLRMRVAGMGVAPEARRAGVGRTLLERVVVDAQARGVRRLSLEVFTTNAAARHLYATHGFVAWRELRGYTLSKETLHARTQQPSGVTLRPIDALAALPLFAACTSGEEQAALPPWQVEGPSLARLQPPMSVYTIAAPDVPRPAGYLAMGVSGASLRLFHLGILPPWRRRGYARAAVRALFDSYPNTTDLSVAALVPAASSMVPFLEACGAAVQPHTQQEMVLELPR